MEARKEHARKKQRIYAIFDRDDESTEQINAAIDYAGKTISIGYSNISFDLWILMHYKPVHASINQKTIEKDLEKLMPCQNYKRDMKNNKNLEQFIGDKIYDTLENRNKSINTEKFSSLKQAIDLEPYTNLHEVIEEIFRIKGFKNRFSSH